MCDQDVLKEGYNLGLKEMRENSKCREARKTWRCLSDVMAIARGRQRQSWEIGRQMQEE